MKRMKIILVSLYFFFIFLLGHASSSLRNIVCKEDEECDQSLCCYFDEIYAVPDTAYNFQSTIHPAHIRKMRFLRSSIPEIPPGIFSYFTSVANVDFRGIGITKTNDYSFSGARRLTTLDLSKNQIEKLVNMMFYGAFRLGYLDLSYNRIHEVEENAFFGLKGLNTLDMSHNQIKVLPEKVFNSVDALYSLNLAHNLLHTLHNELFLDNLFLTKIDLSNNNLVELDKKLFRYNKNIRIFNVSRNAVDSVVFLEDMDFLRIEDLDLSKNPIRDFNFTVIGGMKNLRKLNIAESNLANVDFTAVGRLKNLYSLNISGNHLYKLILNENSAMDNLVKFYIDATNIANLNTKVVKRALPNLKYISLSGNKWNCNTLRSIRDELKHIGVDEVESGVDCGLQPAKLIALSSEKNCVDDVALARIKVKEIIANRLQLAETRIKDEVKRIVNRRAAEIIDEIILSNTNLLNLVIE